MVEKTNKQTYSFTIRGIGYEVFFAQNEAIELYETKSPSTTGFIFENKKVFT